jgi:hypothetical protein
MSGRRRHAEGGRRGLQRKSVVDRTDERVTACQSELGITVKQHLALLSSRGLRRLTASKEGRTYLSAVHNVCRRIS